MGASHHYLRTAVKIYGPVIMPFAPGRQGKKGLRIAWYSHFYQNFHLTVSLQKHRFRES